MKLMIYAVQFKGGSVQVIIALLREFIKFTEHEYHVILSNEIKSQISKFTFPNNFHFYDLPVNAGFSLTNIHKRNIFFKNLEKKINPDCGLCSSGPLYHKTKFPLLVGYNLPHHIYRDSPYFNNITFSSKLRWFLRRNYHRFLYRNEATMCFVQTDDVNNRLKKFIKKENVVTISNTYNTAYNTPIKYPNRLPSRSKDEIRMLTIAAHYPHKNIDIIKSVIDELLNNNIYNYKFVVTLSNENYNRIFGEEYNDYVYNVGFVPTIEGPSLYDECDIMFLPTLLECFSASYAEAMVMKKPIITSDLSFAHVVCKDAAIYFNPTDPIDIANKLIELANNKSLQETLIENGIKQLKQFGTSEDRAKEVLRICSEII